MEALDYLYDDGIYCDDSSQELAELVAFPRLVEIIHDRSDHFEFFQRFRLNTNTLKLVLYVI